VVNQKDSIRWALVTGASAGIGEEFCRQLARLGYSLILVARREDRLTDLAAELTEKLPVQCQCFPKDLSQPEATRELVDQLRSQGVEIEFLVNNAGYGVPGTFGQADWETHRASLQVMLNSVCEMVWRLLPAMQRNGRGYIVNVASLAGLVPGSARHTLYGATKSFLIKFSDSLAMENVDTGVNVSALCPGFTYSEFHDVLDIREQVSQMPSWMWMNAEDVVRYGIESVMRDKPRIVAVPGRVNRFIAALVKMLPGRLAQALTQRESRHWRRQD
jgi:short-subunit dehydrogenase